ncbi:MAG: hypothetical protein A2Y62_20875 [Candidatus Fischerbacteria bacterium RBG_13_37_8]|uniref:PEP-utilising enzyme mobile domain-containing protein n=1 Tax=Candidatus Fischerbacteria bacterium RBG_13_37_8 TaxID=1817863 RepID=A0A1F5VEV0_9BACT|nr:MAG: hypothetical protein A2Y62_20875 [Candidatus Fischerbacteria bacterium RBG_13_37_8]
MKGADQLCKDIVVIWSNWNTCEICPLPLSPAMWSFFTDLFAPEIMKTLLLVTPESPLYPYHDFADLLYGRIYWNMNIIAGHPIFGRVMKSTLKGFDSKVGNHFKDLLQNGDFIPVKFPRSLRGAWHILHNIIILIARILFLMIHANKSYVDRRAARFWHDADEFEYAILENKSNAEMIAEIKEFNAYTIHQWILAVSLLTAKGYMGYGMVDHFLKKMDDINPDMLFRGVGGNKTAEGILELYKLSQMPDSLKTIFQQDDATAIIQQLKQSQEGRQYLQRFETFMNLFGHRCAGEFDLAAERWKDDPTFVFRMIRNYHQLDDSDTNPLQQFQQAAQQRTELTQLARERLSKGFWNKIFPWRRVLFNSMLRMGHEFMPWRENAKYYSIRLHSGIRKRLMEIGKRLVNQGYLENDRDVYYLTVPELEQIAKETNMQESSLKELVNKRKQQLKEYADMEPPTFVRSDGRPFMEVVEQEPESSEAVNILRGAPASPGIVSGIARVIMEPGQGHALQKGEILVAPYTDPGWTPMFLLAKALIMEVGGILSHGAIVAREYGIPAIVSVKGATQLIKTGDQITVDANSGIITKNS